MTRYIKEYFKKFSIIDIAFLACCLVGMVIFYPNVWAIIGLIAIAFLDLLYKTYQVYDDEVQ